MVIIKLTFFSWLAIFGGMSWVLDDYALTGKIASNALCMLAFFGGITGLAGTMATEIKAQQ
ncbi:MAG: hypothetical protein ACO3RW_10460 [Burkholderiaceae bacterium]